MTDILLRCVTLLTSALTNANIIVQADTQINAVTVEQIDTASKSDAQSMTSASLIRRENMMK